MIDYGGARRLGQVQREKVHLAWVVSGRLKVPCSSRLKLLGVEVERRQGIDQAIRISDLAHFGAQ